MRMREVTVVKERGRQIVRVPLGPRSGLFAEIFKEDWDHLIKLGLSPNWNIMRNGYVIASCGKASGGHVVVARVLMNPNSGESVAYVDGNRTNLRRNNLKLKDGSGIRRDRDYLTAAA
jgi:hypothetical protein